MTQRPVLFFALMSMSLAAMSCGNGDGGGGGGGSGGGGTGGGSCTDLTAYKASTTTAYTLAKDILPILQDTSGSTGPSCAFTSICHGAMAVNLYKSSAMMATLQFTGSAADVKTALLANSINDTSMARVKPGDVGKSFLAYKISGKDHLTGCGLTCSGASMGPTTMCGDAMPTLGALSASDKTKILDWIAQGAN